MVYYLNFLNKCISNMFDLVKKNLLKKKKYIKMFCTYIYKMAYHYTSHCYSCFCNVICHMTMTIITDFVINNST